MLELNLVVSNVSDFFENWIIILEYSGRIFPHFGGAIHNIVDTGMTLKYKSMLVPCSPSL